MQYMKRRQQTQLHAWLLINQYLNWPSNMGIPVNKKTEWLNKYFGPFLG